MFKLFKKKKEKDYDINDIQSIKSHIENKYSNPIEDKLRNEVSELRYQLEQEQQSLSKILDKHKTIQKELSYKENKIKELEEELRKLRTPKVVKQFPQKTPIKSSKKSSSKISDMKAKLNLVQKQIKNGN